MRKLVILSVILLSSIGVWAENPIKNSSFELGRAEYGVHRFIRSGKERKFIEPVYDTREKIHGKQSIRFDNPNADAIELFSREYKLVPGKDYTFSFYMKSSKPVSMMARQYAGELIGVHKGDWTLSTTKYFTIEKSWKRYSFKFKAKGKRSWYFAQFRWGNNQDKASDATVWVDAIQVNEGDNATEYAPLAPVEAAIYGDQRIQIKGKQIPCELKAVNYSDSNAKLNAAITVQDTMFPEKVFPVRKLSFNVPAGKVITKPIDTKMGSYGHFKFEGTYTVNEKTNQLGSWFFAEIPKLDTARKYNFKKDSVTGVNSDLGRSSYRAKAQIDGSFLTMNGSNEDTYGEFLKNTGIKLVRVHGGGFEWKTMEVAPGKFDWTDADAMVRFAHKYGLSLMPVLGNMFYIKKQQGNTVNFSVLPVWLLKSPDTTIHQMNGKWNGVSPDPKAWKRFVTTVATKYKGKILAYEITNEPNIALPSAKEYIPYVISSGKIIRKIDPSAAVVGGSITTDLGGRTDEFLMAMGKAGSLKYCDAISFHPYASPLASSTESAQSNIKRLRDITDKFVPGLALWNTELFYIGPAASAFYAIATPATHAQHLLRRLLIDLGENVKQSMPINDGQLMMNELLPHWELGNGMTYNGYVPNDIYVGLSIASDMLNGTIPVQRLKWPSPACGYIYKRKNGQEFAAVWSGSKKQKFTLILPNQTLKLYDMFMNPMKYTDKLRLADYPVFIFGKGLDQLKLETEQAVKTGMAFISLEDGKKMLNLEIINTSAGEAEFAVRPDFVSKPQFIKLAINSKGIVKFNGIKDFDPAKSKIYISDNKKNMTFPFPELIKKTFREGEMIKADNYSFRTTSDTKGFYLNIYVKDSERGIRKDKAPWTGDSVELFFDPYPLDDVSNIHYNSKKNSRLFIAPKSSNGLPEHTSAMDMDIKNVDIKIKDAATGYTVSIFVPWTELKMKHGDVLGFDIKLNDMDNDGKQKWSVWAGTNQNNLYRNRYGLWYPKQ